MSKLNYRRGFQRAWVVASVVWAVAVVAVSIPDQPRQVAVSIPVDYDALAKKAGAIDDWVNVPPAKGKASTFTPPPIESDKGPATPVKLPPPPPGYTLDPASPSSARTLTDADIARYDRRNDLLKYWGLRSSIAFAPPVIGYLILFSILPWIGRGFVKSQPPS